MRRRPQQLIHQIGGHRALHLVDAENLVGLGEPSADDLHRLRPLYSLVAGTNGTDHVVLGCSGASTVLACAAAWPSSRRVLRFGVDGADLALQSVGTENVVGRFDRVVIGSGDGGFSALAAELHAAGVHVTVVARRGTLSRRLRMAVMDVRYLPEPSIAAARSVA